MEILHAKIYFDQCFINACWFYGQNYSLFSYLIRHFGGQFRANPGYVAVILFLIDTGWHATGPYSIISCTITHNVWPRGWVKGDCALWGGKSGIVTAEWNIFQVQRFVTWTWWTCWKQTVKWESYDTNLKWRLHPLEQRYIKTACTGQKQWKKSYGESSSPDRLHSSS